MSYQEPINAVNNAEDNNAISPLGPSQMGTIACARPQLVLDSYCQHLDLHIAENGTITPQLAALWGAEKLAGNRYWLLANKLDHCWLRIIEDSAGENLAAFQYSGWLALEVSVNNVDDLADKLTDSPFRIFRPPADLELSDKIRAFQVVGPAGEVLYLTQLKGAVPPFEIVPARCRVDRLFIPVLSSVNRKQTLAFYENLAQRVGLCFDTKLTSVNQAFGFELDRHHPLATLQLAGNSMLEIDQINAAKPRPQTAGKLPGGIAMVSFEINSFENIAPGSIVTPAQNIDSAPYCGRETICLQGASGELIELIKTPTQ